MMCDRDRVSSSRRVASATKKSRRSRSAMEERIDHSSAPRKSASTWILKKTCFKAPVRCWRPRGCQRSGVTTKAYRPSACTYLAGKPEQAEDDSAQSVAAGDERQLQVVVVAAGTRLFDDVRLALIIRCHRREGAAAAKQVIECRRPDACGAADVFAARPRNWSRRARLGYLEGQAQPTDVRLSLQKCM